MNFPLSTGDLVTDGMTLWGPSSGRGVLAPTLLVGAAMLLAGCGGDNAADTADEEAAAPIEVVDVEPEPAAEPAAEPEPAPEPEPADEPQPAVEPGLVPVAEPEPAADEPPDPMAPIVGMGTARESATIEVDGRRVLLYGLESMHPPMRCFIGGEIWECWAAAVRQLQTFLAEGPVTCTPVGSPDANGRVLGICEQELGNLNERYVRSGFALAVEDEMPEYAELEAEARAEGIGLWQGVFQEPADFRMSRGIFVRRP